ncbi:hypothetical protein [Microbacterium sp. NPDC089188]|uniref:hypothetical protein n=1 Tax=Microbacterium sp. NPDC089188 TaxID=3154971 RepID=UPI00342FF0C4
MASLLTVSGCAITGESKMDPDEARDALVSTVEESAAQLDVTGWARSHAPEAGNCGSRSGQRANYSFVYGAPAPVRDHEGDARRIAEYWRSLGMNVRLVESPEYVVYGSGGPVEGLSFSTGPGNYFIAGESLCVPGDADELRKQDNG